MNKKQKCVYSVECLGQVAKTKACNKTLVEMISVKLGSGVLESKNDLFILIIRGMKILKFSNEVCLRVRLKRILQLINVHPARKTSKS